jgi:SynChlorMet cassette protein ScmC
MYRAFYPIHQRAIEAGGLPFHAGLVEYKGRGLLLAGPGGIGKSTCCRRLPFAWRALCDDETLIVLHKQKGYFAHPFPTWSLHLLGRSEKTWNIQEHLPLDAIFFLEQAKMDEVSPIKSARAAILINQTANAICMRYERVLNLQEKRAQRKKIFVNACALAKSVPCFILRISLKGEFWKKIERVLKDNGRRAI